MSYLPNIKINRVNDKADNIQSQVDNLVVEGDSSPAADQARVDADGTNHPSLKARLDNDVQNLRQKDNELTAQLAQIQQQKANKTEVRENTDTRPINVNEMDTETKSLFTGGAVAVVGEKAVGNENLKPKSVHTENTNFIPTSNNMIGAKNLLYRGLINANTGEESNSISFRSTSFIKIIGGQQYTHKRLTHLTFFDANKTFISGGGYSSNDNAHTVTYPTNAVYARFTVNAGMINVAQVNKGTTLLPYDEFF